MEIDLIRLGADANSTVGVFYLDGQLSYFSLEDEPRDVKVSGKTRIDEGRYELQIKRVLTPLTKKYRQKYPWFIYHLEIVGLPRHDDVYIHVLNTHEETRGCPGVGFTANLSPTLPETIGNSAKAMEDFYKKIYPYLDGGGRAYITITDLENLVVNRLKNKSKINL